MASLIPSGSASGIGSMTLAAPVTNTARTQTLVDVDGTLAPLVSGTAVTASGTSVDFTSIPSWVKRITLMLAGVSTNGADGFVVKIGDSGGLASTGYLGNLFYVHDASAIQVSGLSTGFTILPGSASAANTYHGNVVLTLVNAAANIWSASSMVSPATTSATARLGYMSGSKTLPGTLTQLSLTTGGGTNTFDAGTINIMYE